MHCPNCKAELNGTPKFCLKCGARIEAPQLQSARKTCPQCGTENLPTAKFCKKDGYPFDSVAATQGATASPPPVVVAPVGSKVQEPATRPASSNNTVICPGCGTPNAATARFCKKDGYPLRAAGAATSPAAMASTATPLIPEIAPQAIPAKQAAPVTSHPAVHVVSAAPVRAAAAQSRKNWVIGAVAGLAILASAGGGYAYWMGYIGNRQGNVQEEINAELGSHGLSNIKVTVNHDWVASLAGSVSSQTFKDQAFGLVSGYKELKSIVDTVQIEPSPADVEQALNKALGRGGFSSVPVVQIGKDLVASLHGSAVDQAEKDRMLALAKGVTGVRGVKDEIEVTAPLPFPEPENPEQAEMAPPSPAPPQAPPENSAIDPSKLEGDINRALRNRDINSVTAQVNDDMSLTLKGSASADEKERAMQFARQVRGIRGIKDKIFVVE